MSSPWISILSGKSIEFESNEIYYCIMILARDVRSLERIGVVANENGIDLKSRH